MGKGIRGAAFFCPAIDGQRAASRALLLALSGYRYSGVARRLELAPRRQPEAFNCLWTAPSGWGRVSQAISAGELAVREMRYALPEGATVHAVAVEMAGRNEAARARQDGEWVAIMLERAVRATVGEPLVVQLLQ